MKDANASIFNKLVNLVSEADVAEKNKVRYISTNETEKPWLKNLRVVDKLSILPRLMASVVSYDGKDYFVLVGWEPESIHSEGFFSFQEINAGIATALLSDLEIPLKQDVDSYGVENTIMSQSLEDMPGEYHGHEFQEITRFFDPFAMFEILENSPLKGMDIFRLTLWFFSRNSHNLVLPFSDDSLIVLRDIILDGSELIPFENFLLSLTSFHWKYSFLDVYRCVEGLFALPFLTEIYRELDVKSDFLSFTNSIELATGWRPKEDIALRKIFSEAPKEITDLLIALKNAKSPPVGNDQVSLDNLSDWFYKIRNSVVHYRRSVDKLDFQDDEWDILFRSSLLLTKHIYSFYSAQISSGSS